MQRYMDNAVTRVTTVTDVPKMTRGIGLASTGSVSTDPLVRECPETPGGDAVVGC